MLASDVTTPFWVGFLKGLDGRFRVIAPELPPEEADTTGWLASLLEGLGTSAIRVVAGDRFHAPALEFANGDPDQVACVVLVSETGRPTADARVPVLLVDAAQPARNVAAWVRSFLTRESFRATA